MMRCVRDRRRDVVNRARVECRWLEDKDCEPKTEQEGHCSPEGGRRTHCYPQPTLRHGLIQDKSPPPSNVRIWGRPRSAGPPTTLTRAETADLLLGIDRSPTDRLVVLLFNLCPRSFPTQQSARTDARRSPRRQPTRIPRRNSVIMRTIGFAAFASQQPSRPIPPGGIPTGGRECREFGRIQSGGVNPLSSRSNPFFSWKRRRMESRGAVSLHGRCQWYQRSVSRFSEPAELTFPGIPRVRR
jgi:hypothetical protein